MSISQFIKRVSLLVAMTFLFQSYTSAQMVIEPGNPIVEMLDSLVSLTYNQKLSMTSVQTTTRFQPTEIPVYSDDIYQKRIEKIQTPIPLTYNNQVREFIDLYAVKKRDLTERVMGLSDLYFPQFEQILDREGIPLEFKYLSIVESALNPVAVSCMGATGLWQFMLATGRMYNLKVNSFIDERKDPYKATVAACQYFKDMYAIYNDWLLVIASYNCGPGNVNKAIARSGGKMNFWEISPYLPRETRGYVPAFIAVTYLMNYINEHNLSATAPIISFYDADTVMVDQKVSLKRVAESINAPEELVRYLNPLYKKGIIPDSDEPMALRLPSNKVNTFLANVSTILFPEENSSNSNFASSLTDDNYTYITKTVKKYHKVRRGERLAALADRYDCTVQDIKHWNKMRSTKLATGQRLAVFVTVKQKVEKKQVASVQRVDSALLATACDSTISKDSAAINAPAQQVQNATTNSAKSMDDKFLYHVVQPGDTLWNIALRYDGATVQQLRKINRLNTNSLKIGTKLKVLVNG